MSTAPRFAASEPRYLDRIETSLARVIREAALAEPRVADAGRAFRVLDSFLATMTGYTLGWIARELCGAMRAWFGADGSDTMRAALHGWPCALPPDIAVICDHDRPLTGEALARLHLRFAHVGREVRCLVDAIPAKPATAMMFDVLAKDDALFDRIATELELGWRVFTATVTAAPYPPLSPLWQQWLVRLNGRPALARDAVAEAGYIALVR